MKLFFDTEFIEDGKTIELISIGIVSASGNSYYAENSDADLSRASDWVMENVLPHLSENSSDHASKKEMAREIKEFVADECMKSADYPEFWAWYGAYDWVALCQLYGPMIDLPNGWPMFVRDIKFLQELSGISNLPPQESTKHNALADAEWNKYAYDYIQKHIRLSQ